MTGQSQLGYGSVRRRRVRPGWSFVLAAIAIVIAFAGRPRASALRQQFRSAILACRARNYTPPAGQVVYDENGRRAQALLSDSRYHPGPTFYRPGAGRTRHTTAALKPPGFALPRGMFFFDGSGPVLFMHQRQTHGGTRKIVAISMSIARWATDGERLEPPFSLAAVIVDDRDGMHPDASGFLPMAWCERVGDLRSHLGLPDQPCDLRIYAGQPDPDDAARFLIPVALGDRCGMIEGRLLDVPGKPGSATVELRARVPWPLPPARTNCILLPLEEFNY